MCEAEASAASVVVIPIDELLAEIYEIIWNYFSHQTRFQLKNI